MLEKHLPQESNIMQDWLSARVNATPDKPFLYATDRERGMTFFQLQRQVEQMRAKWQAIGIKRGEHVGLLMINFPLTIVQIFTAMRVGVTLVPLNVRLTTDEIDFQLRQSDCAWLLPYGDAQVLAELRDKGHQIASLDTVKIPKKRQSFTIHEINLENPFSIIHTSGTSGQPKGAVLTYNNIYQSAMASAYHMGVLPDDRWLCVLPLFHVGGLSIIMRSLLYGTAVEMMPKFDIDEVNRVLTERPITLVSLVPTMLHRLLEIRKQAWNPKLRLVLLGGAAPSPELVARCVEEGIPIATTYGLSEASSQVATSTPELVIKKPASVGKPLIFTQVRVVDEQDKDCVADEIGEVIVKSPTVMQGYYKNPSATDKALHEGWLHTGDMGYKDSDGDLYIVQRRSDLIVTGGENVYPTEVENAIRQHPDVKEVVVIGLDDVEWGQKVVAVVQLETGHDLSEEAIIAFSRGHLAGYKIPRIIRFVTEFPQTASGKIQRSEVRKVFANDPIDN